MLSREAVTISKNFSQIEDTLIPTTWGAGLGLVGRVGGGGGNGSSQN